MFSYESTYSFRWSLLDFFASNAFRSLSSDLLADDATTAVVVTVVVVFVRHIVNAIVEKKENNQHAFKMKIPLATVLKHNNDDNNKNGHANKLKSKWQKFKK